MSERHLFKLKVASKQTIGVGAVKMDSNKFAAPQLIPTGSSGPAYTSDFKPQIVNVMKDFQWTHTPPIGRNEVPRLKMSEYSVEWNSVLQQLRYLLTMQRDGTKAVMDIASGLIDKFASSGSKAGNEVVNTAQNNETAKEGAQAGEPESADESKKKASIASKAIAAGLTAQKTAGRLIGDLMLDPPKGLSEQTPWLVPYWGLYGVKPTGFQYIMPYFNENYKTITQTWGDIRGGGIFSHALRTAPEGLVQMITSQFETVAKGAFIDLPKSYHYDQAGTPELNFTVFLYNTNDWGDVVKNWQLIFMLIYQNLANKTSKILLEPPVLYEVEVDGLHYLPYAYINSLKVVNHGTEREMMVPIMIDEADSLHQQFFDAKFADKVPSRHVDYIRRHGTSSTATQGKKMAVKESGSSGASPDPKTRGVLAQIPEAWELQISFKSLLPETKNLMFHAITKSSDIYDVTISTDEGKNLGNAPFIRDKSTDYAADAYGLPKELR